jgi:hypothetical protein
MWWDQQGQPERSIEEGDRARQRNPTLWLIPFRNGFAHLDQIHSHRELARTERLEQHRDELALLLGDLRLVSHILGLDGIRRPHDDRAHRIGELPSNPGIPVDRSGTC